MNQKPPLSYQFGYQGARFLFAAIITGAVAASLKFFGASDIVAAMFAAAYGVGAWIKTS